MSQLVLDQGSLTSLTVNDPWQTVVSATTTAIDVTKGDHIYIPLTASITTVSNAVGMKDGDHLIFLFLNTSSNYTVGWGTAYKFVGTSAPTITTGAHYSIVSFVYHATSGFFIEFNRNLNVG